MEISATYKSVRDVFIEWGDCDPAGIVYYPRYFEMFDAATAHFLASATGMSKYDLLLANDAVGFPMVSTGAEFRSPARYGDTVRIETFVASVGRSSFEVRHQLFHGAELAIEAHEKRVWVVREGDGGIRSSALPETVAAALRR